MTAAASPTWTGRPAARRAGGFTYLGMIILVVIIGLVGAATLKIGSLLQRAAAEQELLDIGAAFSDALQSYAAATPPGQPQQPPSLQELLKDPRYPTVRRHLRKLYVDPITGKQEWGIMYLADKVGVVGVYSLSDAQPLKIANFDARFQNFENRRHISEWKFTPSGQGAVAPPPVVPPTPIQVAEPPAAPTAPAVPPQPELTELPSTQPPEGTPAEEPKPEPDPVPEPAAEEK